MSDETDDAVRYFDDLVRRARRRMHLNGAVPGRAFDAQTGVPMVLNTSFNENEPIVCRPEEALECFLRTGMDVLVLGDIMIER